MTKEDPPTPQTKQTHKNKTKQKTMIIVGYIVSMG